MKLEEIRALAYKAAQLGEEGPALGVEQVRDLIGVLTKLVTVLLVDDGHEPRDVLRVTTKLRDAGRRSPPWKPASSKVPGRPQDGADGNRRLRWLFDEVHKFYADEVTATLVEVKYYLEILSMENAPDPGVGEFKSAFGWLVDYPVEPGAYLDPIQLVPIDLKLFVADRRYVESGHLVPLDRGGRHVPQNSFLMLAGSNRLQGNLTVEELLVLMEKILQRHHAIGHSIKMDLPVSSTADSAPSS